MLLGCGESEPTGEPPGASEDPGPIHVHALGINPGDGALFIATHTGLFRAPEGASEAERVADRYQDTMGFTIVGPDQFLGSGHPDGREDLPPFLGLIRSDDAGETWEPVSLLGKADFHALESSGDVVYGFGSDFKTREQRLLVSTDAGKTWEQRRLPERPPDSPLEEALRSIVIDPADPSTVVASGQEGIWESRDQGRNWSFRSADTGLLAWPRTGELYLVADDGELMISGDRGQSWESVGSIGREPAAFESEPDGLYVALHDGTIKRSGDGGASWDVRSSPSRAYGSKFERDVDSAGFESSIGSRCGPSGSRDHFVAPGRRAEAIADSDVIEAGVRENARELPADVRGRGLESVEYLHGHQHRDPHQRVLGRPEVADDDAATGTKNPNDFPSGPPLLLDRQMVEEEGREDHVKAGVGVGERIRPAFVQGDRQPGRIRPAACLGEDLRIGVEAGDLDAGRGARRLDRQRAGPAADVQNRLSRGDRRLLQHPALERAVAHRDGGDEVKERRQAPEPERGDEVGLGALSPHRLSLASGHLPAEALSSRTASTTLTQSAAARSRPW
jgi:hypothetical protein